MPHHTPNHRSGFTLVELSIVMVIIGMLVGGIMAGQSLIRASNLQTILTDKQQYISATAAFKEKYMAIPGDFSDANASFGGTNGDGDGLIELGAAANATGERFEFWRHLQLDNQIAGNFSGLAGSGGVQHTVIGVNVPRSQITDVGWTALSAPFYAGDTTAFAIDYGHGLLIGATITNNVAAGPFLKPEETWNIDTKIDDGKPGMGSVIARYWDTCTDAADNTAASAAVANYLLSDSTVQCSLYFIKAF